MANPRLSCAVSPLIVKYVEEIQRRGFHGETRSEVVRRLLCSAIMEALSGDTINRIVEMHATSETANHHAR